MSDMGAVQDASTWQLPRADSAMRNSVGQRFDHARRLRSVRGRHGISAVICALPTLRRWSCGMSGRSGGRIGSVTRWQIPAPLPVGWTMRSLDSATVTAGFLADGRFRQRIEHAPLPGVTPAMCLWYLERAGT